MFFRSCTFTRFLINADVNVNKFVFPLSTHFRNDFSSNSYENITFSIQNTHAHKFNPTFTTYSNFTLHTSIFIYSISAVGSIWILLFSKNNYAISTYSNTMELYRKKLYPFIFQTKKSAWP